MNKKAYLRTLEAVMAIILFLIAMFTILSLQETKSDLKPEDIELMQDTILNQIKNNEDYREEIFDNDIGPFSEVYIFIEEKLEKTNLGFSIFACDGMNSCNPPSIDQEKVYADSIIISKKDNGDVKTAIFFLYLWRV